MRIKLKEMSDHSRAALAERIGWASEVLRPETVSHETVPLGEGVAFDVVSGALTFQQHFLDGGFLEALFTAYYGVPNITDLASVTPADLVKAEQRVGFGLSRLIEIVEFSPPNNP